MDNCEKVTKGLECCLPMTTKDGFGDCFNCPYNRTPSPEESITICCHGLMADALALLKTQEPTTIEPKCIELVDKTKAWLDEMDAVDALSNIADICVDWDGYRTADGLGGLINEIWAYAQYCAARLLKAQEPVKPEREDDRPISPLRCGNCGAYIVVGNGFKAKYCYECGKAVKWDG